MRIIAGSARGRKLLPPEGMGTRPTLDRIKEAMFNIIQTRVYGSTILDMFSGTGSLGLEAVSRGAKKAVLIDKGDTSFKLLKKNVENLGFEQICSCLNMDSYLALDKLSDAGMVFDIIFIDPPYCKEMIPKAVELIEEKNLLAKGGIIATKIDTSEEIYWGSARIKLTDKRKYGNTTVIFYEEETK